MDVDDFADAEVWTHSNMTSASRTFVSFCFESFYKKEEILRSFRRPAVVNNFARDLHNDFHDLHQRLLWLLKNGLKKIRQFFSAP